MRFVVASASVFAVFSSKKMRQPTGYTVQKNAELSSSHRVFFCVFLCVCVCVASRIGFYGVLADSRLFAHASLDLHLSFRSVGGGGGMGGWGGEGGWGGGGGGGG